MRSNTCDSYATPPLGVLFGTEVTRQNTHVRLHASHSATCLLHSNIPPNRKVAALFEAQFSTFHFRKNCYCYCRFCILVALYASWSFFPCARIYIYILAVADSSPVWHMLIKTRLKGLPHAKVRVPYRKP